MRMPQLGRAETNGRRNLAKMQTLPEYRDLFATDPQATGDDADADDHRDPPPRDLRIQPPADSTIRSMTRSATSARVTQYFTQLKQAIKWIWSFLPELQGQARYASTRF